jgi:hypothetical protein
VGPWAKQWKRKRVGVHSLICNTLGIGGHVGALGWIGMNSKTRVQNDINLHNQEKKAVNASWIEVV